MEEYFDNEIYYVENFPPLIDGHAEFSECHFNGIDFTDYNFSRMKFLDCEFIECNLSNVSLTNASFRDVVFRKSKLLGLNWSPVNTLSNVSFLESLMDYSVFQSLNLKGVVFSVCKMCDVDFYESQLVKSTFTDCYLRGAVFNKANLSESDFRGAKDYFIDVRVTQVTKAKFSLPEGLTLLSSLDITLE